jgi:hypothetical protein
MTAVMDTVASMTENERDKLTTLHGSFQQARNCDVAGLYVIPATILRAATQNTCWMAHSATTMPTARSADETESPTFTLMCLCTVAHTENGMVYIRIPNRALVVSAAAILS